MKYYDFKQKEEKILKNFYKDGERRNIEIVRTWSLDKVDELCHKHNFYTLGDSAEYEGMLDIIETDMPSLNNLYIVAKDIFDHSTCKYNKDNEIINDTLINSMIGVIMEYLENETVETEYYIK